MKVKTSFSEFQNSLIQGSSYLLFHSCFKFNLLVQNVQTGRYFLRAFMNYICITIIMFKSLFQVDYSLVNPKNCALIIGLPILAGFLSIKHLKISKLNLAFPPILLLWECPCFGLCLFLHIFARSKIHSIKYYDNEHLTSVNCSSMNE